MEVVGPDHRHQPGGRSAVTIGAYDGVHLGHRAVLGELRALASDRSLETVVVTFDRHPASVVRPESAPYLLTDLAQKLELLADCGVDRTLVLPFDRRRADEAAEEFIAEVLVEALGAQLVVVGTDFHFGHGRKGNVALLREQGDGARLRGGRFWTPRRRGDPGVVDARFASSWPGATWLRHPGSSGETTRCAARWCAGTAAAAPCWACPPPTSTSPGRSPCPAKGSTPGGTPQRTLRRPRPHSGPRHPAAISVGRRPTFYGSEGESLVEAHLLDFSGDLYDRPARVTFHRPIRQGQVEFRERGRADRPDAQGRRGRPPPPRIRLTSGNLACGREDLPTGVTPDRAIPRACSLVEGVRCLRPG